MSQFVLVVASHEITEFMLVILAIFFSLPARASGAGFRAAMFSACLLARGCIVRDHQVHTHGSFENFAPPAHASDRSAGFAPHCSLSASLPVVLPCEITEFVPVAPARA